MVGGGMIGLSTLHNIHDVLAGHDLFVDNSWFMVELLPGEAVDRGLPALRRLFLPQRNNSKR